MIDQCLPLFAQYETLVKEQIKAVCIQISHKTSAADALPRDSDYYLKCYNDENLSWAQAIENVISESDSKFGPPLLPKELIKCAVYIEGVNAVEISTLLQEVGKLNLDDKAVNSVVHNLLEWFPVMSLSCSS